MEHTLTSFLSAISRFEYLIAKKEYEKLVDQMEKHGREGDIFRQCHVKPHDKLIATMLQKCDEIQMAFEVCGQEHEDWIVGSVKNGITTKYLIDDEGFIHLKVDGELTDLPLYEQLVVIWEVALYHLWVPYCSESRIVKSFDNSEFITTMTLNPPFGITRDIVVHAFGANCLAEQNALVLVTKSLTDSARDKELAADCALPPLSKGFFSDRVHMHHLYCINTMSSSTSTKFTAVLKLDPKLGFGLPGSVLSWFINQLVGVVLPLLRKQAISLAEADPYNNPFTNQIRKSSQFYVDFLLPIYRDYVQRQGWAQPVIRCLYDKGIPQSDVDYCTSRAAADATVQQTLFVRLPVSSPAICHRKRQVQGGGRSSPGEGRGDRDRDRDRACSGSDLSADFFSCLDDEEFQQDRRFSRDEVKEEEEAAAAKGSRCKAALVSAEEGDEMGEGSGGKEQEEPFLGGRMQHVGTSSERVGGCCSLSRSCCLRWLCCSFACGGAEL